MKFSKFILFFTILLGLTTTFQGCDETKDIDRLSDAVLASVNSLTFEAQNPKGQMITVYADANWVAEVPDWVSISPTEGNGVVDVTVSVLENMRDGAVDNPRTTNLVFKGGTLASRATVIIYQNGDKYRGVKNYNVGEVSKLENGTTVIVTSAIVTALADGGFIVSDKQGTSTLFVSSTTAVAIGDEVVIRGTKSTDTMDLSLVECDEVQVVASGTSVTYPDPKDITETIDTYSASTYEYITVTGQFVGSTITVSDKAKNTINVINLSQTPQLGELNGHMVTVTGFFAGISGTSIRFITTQVVDKGVLEVIYFSEDFEWLAPWAEASNAGSTVENDGSGSAPNIHTVAALKTTLLPEFESRGYSFVCQPETTTSVYIQKNYLKFGRTDVQSGIVLPSIDNIPKGAKVQISFDWAPMVGGTRKFDQVEVVVVVTNGDNSVEYGPVGHTFQNEVDVLSWLHADIALENATITESTKITIRTKVWGESSSNNGGTKIYQRWFIDNIKISKVD